MSNQTDECSVVFKEVGDAAASRDKHLRILMVVARFE